MNTLSVGYIKAFITYYHFYLFSHFMSIKTLRGSVLELISFIRLIDRKDIQSVKVVWLVLKF